MLSKLCSKRCYMMLLKVTQVDTKHTEIVNYYERNSKGAVLDGKSNSRACQCLQFICSLKTLYLHTKIVSQHKTVSL